MHSPLPTKCLRLSLGAFFALSPLAFAQDTTSTAGADAQQSAYRNSIAEETVRKQADKIQGEINELVAELKLNGLDGADLAILASASNHLQSLSQDQMQKVINALQSASLATQSQDRQQSLVNAYQGQQDVTLKLKSLAADLAAQESQKEIPSKLENLIARQSANIRETTALAASGHSVDQLNAQQKSAHDVVSSEQTSIGGEIDILLKVLAATPPPAPAAAAPDKSTPDISKTTLDAMNTSPLKDSVQAATQLTSNGPFPDAVTKQKSVRDYLTAILRVSLSTTDAVSRLQDIKAQLDQIVDDQKDLADATAEAKLDGSVLAERQAKIDDRTSVTDALLKPISAPASSQIDIAQQAMGQSSSSLEATKNPADSVPQVQTVVDDLQKAQALLEKQLADAQAEQSMSAMDKLAQLQQLQAEITQAQNNPSVTPADLQKLEQDATTPSPQAASKIADAADQLQQPQPNMPAANQALADANAAMQAQEAALQQTAQAQQALDQANQQLAQAQQEAADANQNMQSNATQAAKDLSQAQANVDQAAQQQGVPSDAQQALQQASDALKNATMSAVQAQAGQAQAQDKQAMASMQQAQKSLGQAMAQAGQGQPQPNSQSTQGMATDSSDQQTALLGGFGSGGTAQVVGGLKPKDRDAIVQFQAEKSPPEYAPMVQQYLKNLADSSDNH